MTVLVPGKNCSENPSRMIPKPNSSTESSPLQSRRNARAFAASSLPKWNHPTSGGRSFIARPPPSDARVQESTPQPERSQVGQLPYSLGDLSFTFLGGIPESPPSPVCPVGS